MDVILALSYCALGVLAVGSSIVFHIYRLITEPDLPPFE